jgi:hypothetical protein
MFAGESTPRGNYANYSSAMKTAPRLFEHNYFYPFTGVEEIHRSALQFTRKGRKLLE